MKKFMPLLIAFGIVLSAFGTITAFAQSVSPHIQQVKAHIEGILGGGSWGDKPIRKAFSRQELDECLDAVPEGNKIELPQYNDDFFKDKFVCLAYLKSGNEMIIHITSISVGVKTIDVEASFEFESNLEDAMTYCAVIEVDKSLSDRDIRVNLTDLEKYCIFYYNGAVNGMQYNGYSPSIKLITSREALEGCTNNSECLHAYSHELYSKRYCVLLIAWNEPRQVITHRVANIEYHDNSTYQITLTKAIPNEEYPETVTPYFAAIMLPIEHQYAVFDIRVKDMYSFSDYSYSINGLLITNTEGEAITKPVENEDFVVKTDIVKAQERNEKDCLFVAVYDENGALMSLDCAEAKFNAGDECTFDFNIPAQHQKIGSIKVFVWNTFVAMKPLAETKTLTFATK